MSWQSFAGQPPEWRLAAGLRRRQQDFLVLPGNAQAGPEGRFGFVGSPSKLTSLPYNTGAQSDALIAAALAPAPRWKVMLLPFEWGRPWLSLEPDGGATLPALIAEFDSGAVIDHERRLYHVFGQMRDEPAVLEYRAVAAPDLQLLAEIDDASHMRRIEQALNHIRAGDIYQATVARPLRLVSRDRQPIDGFGSLHRLARKGNAAHQAYLRLGEVELLSNTMETLLTYDPETRRASSRPIKGTRRDAETLAGHPKERAEHVMIVDLVRNDLGRVCVPGSVRVDELMGIYPFPGLHHGISTVTGRLSQDHTVLDLVRSLFPGGSITGAPKRRAMELIRAIEGRPRGYYTGSLALISPAGRVSMSILIRSAYRLADEPWRLGVGGGIVIDSEAEREVQETWEKVSVFCDLWQADCRPGLVAGSVARGRCCPVDRPQLADARPRGSW